MDIGSKAHAAICPYELVAPPGRSSRKSGSRSGLYFADDFALESMPLLDRSA